MRVGIVSPYSFDAPGGVQVHIRDLAEELISRGHQVSVLAPAEDTSTLPPFVVSAGKSIAVPYNGSVARLSFGTRAAARVATWLEEGNFDILHIHEPVAPSLGLIALWQSKVPIVATFHSSQEHSRALALAAPALQSLLGKIGARIAVSEEARRTVIDHVGGDAVIVPNGVYLHTFRTATPATQWAGRRHGGPPTVCFLGRLDEPRKGLPVLAGAIGPVLAHYPEARFLIAGRGEAEDVRAELAQFGDSVTFLGGVTDEEKAALFASADCYVAPQTGGESFGIVLVEAMAGGARVVASDLPAFRAVLGGNGVLFEVGSSPALVQALLRSLSDDAATPTPATVQAWVERFDWATVATQILDVYGLVLSAAEASGGAEVGGESGRLPYRWWDLGLRRSRALAARANAEVLRTGALLEDALRARAQFALELAQSTHVDPATGMLLADLAGRCLQFPASLSAGADAGAFTAVLRERAVPESELSRGLRVMVPELRDSGSADPELAGLLNRLTDAWKRAILARSVYNGRVAQALSRRRSLARRWTRLTTPEPVPFEMDDALEEE